VKIIAMYLTKRYAAMPEVSTVMEALPGYENPEAFTAVFGPAGVPQAVVSRLHAAIAKGLNSPEIRKQIESRGQMVLANTPEEFAAQIRSLTELAARLVKAAGIRPE
jgi:tripartite-type tricarboxylate transporter receptor subunit TctC